MLGAKPNLCSLRTEMWLRGGQRCPGGAAGAHGQSSVLMGGWAEICVHFPSRGNGVTFWDPGSPTSLWGPLVGWDRNLQGSWVWGMCRDRALLCGWQHRAELYQRGVWL